MTEDAGEEIKVSKDVKTEELPPYVHPFKYKSTDPRDLELEEAFSSHQFDWWNGRYRDKVPQAQEWWGGDKAFGMERWVDKTPKEELAKDEFLQEAIAAFPRKSWPFMIMAKKIPLSSRLLALGIVNAMAIEPSVYEWDRENRLKDRETVIFEQRWQGVSEEALEEAQRLAALWESQQKPFTLTEAGRQSPPV